MALSADRFFRAQITKRADFSADLWTIRVDPGAEFRFLAGQYATLGVETPDKRIERPYSIVSSPYERELEFFIELVPTGDLTPALYQLRPGDSMSLRKSAKGRFTLDIQSTRKHHLLLCTVTGVAPFVSYIRTLHKDWKDGTFRGEQKLFLIDGASRSWELAYRTELEKYAEEVAWLTYVPAISRPWEDTDWKGETGRVDDVIRKYADQWGLHGSDTTAYLCGHPEMIEHGKGILRRHGWAKEAMKEEVYFIPEKTAAPKLVSN